MNYTINYRGIVVKKKVICVAPGHNTIRISIFISWTLKSWVNTISMLFRTFSPRLGDIGTFQCSSDSFQHLPHYSGVCKTPRTTFWYIIILQSRGEGHEKAYNYGTDSEQIFRTFSPQLENNDTLKCSSDSFAHTLRYVVNVENCQNYIGISHYPPILGRRS